MSTAAEPVTAIAPPPNTMEVARSMCVLDETGDSRIQWDPGNPEEVAKAQFRFEELTKKGYLAYKVNKKGDRGEVDPSVQPERRAHHLTQPNGRRLACA